MNINKIFNEIIIKQNTKNIVTNYKNEIKEFF